MPPMTPSPLNVLVMSFISAEYAGRPNAAKRLARIANATRRAAENWLAGLNAPAGDRLANLMAAHPELEQAVVTNIHHRRATMRERAEAAADRARTRLAGGHPE